MTKLTLIAAFVIGIIIVAGAYYYASKATLLGTNAPIDLQPYYAKKEDLMNTQQKLAIAINELNKTIQLEITQQQILSSKVEVLSGQANTPPPSININIPQIVTPIKQPSVASQNSPPAQQVFSAPPPPPPPPPVTRAS